MTTLRFIHAADVHLGCAQYGSVQRYNDFAAAFDHLVDATVAERADLLLLAGDLFHKRSMDPQTLWQATSILLRLRDARIPVFAVQGNHERPQPGARTSWLDYLADLGLLYLLGPRYGEDRAILEPWSAETGRGAYVDLPGGVRILGLPYAGASTPFAVQSLARALQEEHGPRPQYTILLMHAGLQGILDTYSATLSRSQLDPLRDHIDYLALGHIHKPFQQDDWIYNPGSLETTSMTEVAWPERGYFVVDVDTSRSPAHAVRPVCNPRRVFRRYTFPVAGHDTPEDLAEALLGRLTPEATPALRACEPVVEVELLGALPFSRGDLDVSALESRIGDLFAATVCRLRDETAPADYDVGPAEGLTRPELERHVLRELIERDVRYRGHSAEWANLVLRIKQAVLTGSSPAEIADELAALTAAIPAEAAPSAVAQNAAAEDGGGEGGAPC